MDSILTKNQKKIFKKVFNEGNREYVIIAKVRYDDECGNGHNTFSITGEIWKSINGQVIGNDCESCGCIHESIKKHFPELSHLIKWHLCNNNGPLGYFVNTLYFAGNKDHNDLLKGEARIKSYYISIDGALLVLWPEEKNRILGPKVREFDTKKEAEKALSESYFEENKFNKVIEYVKLYSEGKERELDHARSSAVWPDATDEELCSSDLKERLIERLPKLIKEFKEIIESLGFTY